MRNWLIKLIVGKRPIVMNMYLLSGLYIDTEKTGERIFLESVQIDLSKKMPEGVGVYFSGSTDTCTLAGNTEIINRGNDE